MNPQFLCLIALVSGLLMGVTTAPVNAWFCGWFALIPLWILLRFNLSNNCQKSGIFTLNNFNLKSVIIYAGLWGIGYHGFALSWILGIHPMTWLGVPWWPSLGMALLCWFLLTLVGAIFVISWGITVSYLWLIESNLSFLKPSISGLTLSIINLLIGVGIWCSLESLWSSGALWWTSLSYTQSPHNLAILHLAQWSGPNTITAIIVAFNGLIAESFFLSKRNKNFWQISAVILLIIFHLIGFYLYSRPLEDQAEMALKIGVIQGNIPNEIKFDSRGWRRALERYTQAYQKLADQGVDGVLTPETALPFLWTNENIRSDLSFYQAILEKKVLAWVGGFAQKIYPNESEKNLDFTNSLLTLNGEGKIISQYDKIKLVPLGEYIPFSQWIGGIIRRLSPLDSQLIAGNFDQVVDTPWGKIIVGICYDSAFSTIFYQQARQGGLFILTASNDAHYFVWMMTQHYAQDIMRAVETDRWLVRATNTGYSGFINPHGETIWLSETQQFQFHAETIYRRKNQTFYVRHGDTLTPILLLFILLTSSIKLWR